ncbi:MAG: redox-regulated ATPase YchF [Chloroflexi bacterium]|nr:redox-regulated ATPase YchF [Chloroflexota bacterium]MYF21188.1 redox-regulated ATPase YchF [Chloroflexota bacterium]
MTSIGLIGFERSGKTTLFNALTGAGRATGFSTHQDPHEGVVPAPDARLTRLSQLYQPRKTTPSVLDVVDFPGAGFAGALSGSSEPPSSRLLDQLAQLDALVHVVRAFDNDAVPHPAERIDPGADIEAMQLELTFADLALIEKRLQRIAQETKSMKAAERVAADREVDLLGRLQAHLGDGGTLLDAPISDLERADIRHYRFLTERPMLTIFNVGEDAASIGGVEGIALSARLEEELRDFDDDEAAAYREELGVGAGAVETALQETFRLLGLRTFFTVGPDECRAWTTRSGDTAPQAAGRIHTDMERGFIRAEVVRWDDLLTCGEAVGASAAEAEAKKRALSRTEGKDYAVRDGDVLHILFNV